MGNLPGKIVGDSDHGKEETLTGHDGMREIDGFLIDAVGSETEHIGGKTCATDESGRTEYCRIISENRTREYYFIN